MGQAFQPAGRQECLPHLFLRRFYGIVENNFGPNSKGWQHWDCGETGKYSNEALRTAVTKRIEPTVAFLAKNNLGFLCKNGGSPYDDSPKPGQPNAEPDYKTITDHKNKPMLYVTVDTPTRISDHWTVITDGQ